MTDSVAIIDVGTMEYRAAWEKQLLFHEEVLARKPGRSAGVLMLVEHPPVVTIGRHPNSAQHLLASPQLLKSRGVDVVETDRGGDITFHGPGQIVGYPIIPLNDYHLNLHAYMRMLEETIIQTIAGYGISGHRISGATGVWVPPVKDVKAVDDPMQLAKVCAMGVKLKRWVTLHGWALNVNTDLSFFTLINPCGLGRPVTSLTKILGTEAPTQEQVKKDLAAQFAYQLAHVTSSAA